MTIIPIENTNQMPLFATYRGVQAKTDEQALSELESIAERLGIVFREVYKYGQGYYYGRVEG